ncbi:MAG: ABC transporter substrate-binding protein [Thermoleophilia bacterium]|nr:ABC transporter substrate-binding protein [Thermoleophilia bacterium]
MKRTSLVVPLLLMATLAGACGGAAQEEAVPEGPAPVKFMLDWVPNTNHTGIFVARDKGYFEEVGLDVQIIEPGEVYPEAAVASGAADFGISFQESVTLARAEEAPIVSIAAVLQHNTSGFASLAALDVTSPADFEGLRYGAWGSPSEIPTLKALMECSGADFEKLEMVTTGFSDSMALLAEKQVDLVWIYYGWQGIQAEEKGIDLSVVMMEDYSHCVPDFYTPVVITSESNADKQPELIRAVLEALSRGYTFAAEHPDEAADILLKAVPELDSAIVRKSQRWLSEYHIAEASRWGEQKASVWQDYADWMMENGVAKTPIVVEEAFTNEFLPQ